MAAAVGLCVLFVLLGLGMPIAFALLLAGVVGLYLIGGIPMMLGILETAPLSAASGYELVTAPMFILMAEFVILSGISDAVYEAAKRWVGRIPGGLAIATAFAGAGFGAISGSSTASAATLSSTTVPAMLKQGYEPKLATGVVAISGTLAMLIPPSFALVFYGIIADVGIGSLLIAGIIPGLIVTMAIAATVFALVLADRSRAPLSASYSFREKLASLTVIGPMTALFACVTGMIYSGISTPTEASAVGAAGALLLAAYERKLTWRKFIRATNNAARTTCMILIIIMTAHVFGYFFALTRITQDILAFVSEMGLPAYFVLAVVLLIYLILGCFLDQIAILVLTVPVTLPLVVSLGFDPIWFGVIVIVMAEIGLVTPPLGLNVFVVSEYTGRPTGEVFAGVMPHVLVHLLVVILLCAFPEIILWLPSTIGK